MIYNITPGAERSAPTVLVKHQGDSRIQNEPSTFEPTHIFGYVVAKTFTGGLEREVE